MVRKKASSLEEALGMSRTRVVTPSPVARGGVGYGKYERCRSKLYILRSHG
jgi:hypothetical protein